MKNRVKLILRDLEAVRENLLALSDDIWLSIDHNDPDSLEEGYQFKKAYNQSLIHHENFISRRGNKTFSNSPDDFANVAIPITKDIYADGNLSANSIRNNMKKLMEVFEIPIDQLVIYLREDRNAEK